MSIFGRRTVQPGDRVAIDTPYLNGTAVVIDGPDYEKGTKVYPKFLFAFEDGVIIDPSSSFVSKLTEQDQLWLEDNAKYISIFGVDDKNITLF